MEPPVPVPSTGPGFRDLMGFMAGYAVAASLLRHLRPGDSAGLSSWAGFTLAFLWYGLAASGAFVAWLFRVGDPGSSSRPDAGRAAVAGGSVPDRSWSRLPSLSPERVWIHLGALFLCLAVWGNPDSDSYATQLTTQTWVFCVILSIVLLTQERPPVPRWTDRLVWVILLTWPLATCGLRMMTPKS